MGEINQDIKSILQELNNAYSNGDCSSMKELLQNLEEVDPQNPYLKRYKTMYQKVCENNDNENGGSSSEQKGKKVKIGGKDIKCPSCGSFLSYNEDVKNKINSYKKGKINQLDFNCQYCGTDFVWGKKGVEKFFLKTVGVGKEVTYNNTKYRVTGVVRYSGKWNENGNSGELDYNEWLLVDDSGNVSYLSESKSEWTEGGESGTEYETEISKKVVPEFQINEIGNETISINDGNYEVKERNEVKVEKVFGENTKSYTVGEQVTLYKFDYNGETYVLEKEETNDQKEIGIYKAEKVDFESDQGQITNDESENLFDLSNLLQSDYRGNFIGFTIFISFFLYLFFGPFFFIFLAIILILYVFSYVLPRKHLIGLGLMFVSFIIMFGIGNNMFSVEKKYDNIDKFLSNDINNIKGIYKISFKNTDYTILEDRDRYDYGGVMYDFKDLKGIEFKIDDKKDKRAIKDILDGNFSINDFEINDESLKVKNDHKNVISSVNNISSYKDRFNDEIGHINNNSNDDLGNNSSNKSNSKDGKNITIDYLQEKIKSNKLKKLE